MTIAGDPTRPLYRPLTRPTFSPDGLLIAFWVVVAACLAGRVGSLLNYAFPLMGVVTAAILLRQSVPHYAVLVWSLWCFTPLVRRIIDYQAGWNPLNPVVLAAPLATALAGVTVLESFANWRSPKRRPFFLVVAAVVYAFGIGVARNGFYSATFDLLGWVGPPLFALRLSNSTRQSRGAMPDGSMASPGALLINRFLPAAAIAMGLYAVVQFASPLPWDRAWMESADVNSIGYPEPFRLRAYGTMNAPVPFAITLMTVALLLPAALGRLTWVAVALATSGLLLTRVRSAWVGYVVGLAMAALLAPTRMKRRVLFVVAVVAVAVALTLFAVAPGASEIVDRASSFGDLASDESFNARITFNRDFLPLALTEPFGAGLGSVGTATRLGSESDAHRLLDFDSGILKVLFVLGWPGTILYCWGLFGMTAGLWTDARRAPPNSSVFARSVMASLVALAVQMPFTSVLDGVQGLGLWSVVGIALAHVPETPGGRARAGGAA